MSCFGRLFQEPTTKEQRIAKGLEWYIKAADLGSIEAQMRLAETYFTGFVVKRDHAKTLEFYKKAADQRHAEAKFQ